MAEGSPSTSALEPNARICASITKPVRSLDDSERKNKEEEKEGASQNARVRMRTLQSGLFA